MLVKQIAIRLENELTLDRGTLEAAGPGARLRLMVQKGEIRILGDTSRSPEDDLDELAGCLGDEPATDYGFSLEL